MYPLSEQCYERKVCLLLVWAYTESCEIIERRLKSGSPYNDYHGKGGCGTEHMGRQSGDCRSATHSSGVQWLHYDAEGGAWVSLWAARF